ncbi:MAG: quinone oxidoreductase family protein [Gammaproteobacteria bacterium]
MQNVVQIDEQGSPAVMQLVQGELADPGPGEVRIRHTAVGLNYMDIYQRGGQYAVTLPMQLGLEAAGTIEGIGADAEGFAVGDRVAYGPAPPGAYADRRNVPVARLVRIPQGISDEQAAACLLKGITAEYLLERAWAVKAGDPVLFYAAAGGVGLIAGQWGRALGARMIGVAGGERKCSLAAENGYEEVIDRTREDVVERVKSLTAGAGVAVAYDSIGKHTFEHTLDCLRPRGCFVSFGTTSGAVPPVQAKALQDRGSLYFTRPTLANYAATRADLDHAAGRVFEMVQSGAVKVNIGQRYALSDVVKAHEDLETGKTSGATVLIP